MYARHESEAPHWTPFAYARILLEHEGVSVVGATTTGAEAFMLAEELEPDVVLLISTHSLEDFAELVADSPARGFLHKPVLSVQAIREVLDETE
ncbi:hypothetical protein [Streptomyces sp. NPDC050704]|uniref:hypothetical protein n=1 Tax=Streptomyces sp. NPDC050704 TaxID=3157219 RepID=UPI003439F173